MTDRRRRNDPQAQQDAQQQAELEAAEQGPDDLAVQTRPTGRMLELLEKIARRIRPDPEEDSQATLLPVVPQDGRQLIAAGQDFDFSINGLPNVAGLVFDVPENVDATVTRDDNALIGIDDGQGRSGTFDLPGEQVAAWSNVGISGTNNAGNAQDIGLWVAVIYGGGPT